MHLKIVMLLSLMMFLISCASRGEKLRSFAFTFVETEQGTMSCLDEEQTIMLWNLIQETYDDR
jgi:hypothetical protein